MVSKGTFYGLAAVLVATTLVSSSFAATYYGQYQQQASQTQKYVGELNAALARYDALVSSYQTALKDYNSTISLLSQALANVNTSSPAYQHGSRELTSLWQSYLNLTRRTASPAVYSVDILIEYGNGTRRWYNDTAVQPGWNAYIATLVTASGNLQATWYPSYGEHFVTGIGGVNNDPANNKAWLLWTWNSTKSWQTAPVGPDLLPAFNGSMFAWTYCPYDPNTYAPLCAP